MHGARDVITGKVWFLILTDNQYSETVLQHIKKLPKTAKIINADYGTSYLAIIVQEHLERNNILHSLGRVVVHMIIVKLKTFEKESNMNDLHNIILNMSNEYVQLLMDQYRYFFNNQRISSYCN